jgi:hypothetical protein
VSEAEKGDLKCAERPQQGGERKKKKKKKGKDMGRIRSDVADNVGGGEDEDQDEGREKEEGKD